MRSVFFFVLLTLLLRVQAAPFKNASFLMYGSFSNVAAVFEYDYDGNFIQTISLPGYLNAISGFPNTDGTLISISLGQTVNSEDLKVCTILNANGELMGDLTKIVNIEYKSCSINGNDVWMNTYRAISYVKRGTTKDITTDNTISTPTGLFTTTMQLVNNKLFILGNAQLYVQDPVLSTTSGAADAVGAVSALIFVMHNNNILYTYKNQIFSKYTLDASNVPTLAYKFTQSIATIGNIWGLTAADYGGSTYIFLAYDQGVGSVKVVRVMDDGTAIGSERVLMTAGANTVWQAISTAPMAACSDGYKDQDETDVDCGGSKCNTCDDGKSCSANSDCTNDFCDPNNKCATPTCADTYQNQDETDVDCGGSCSGCADGKACISDGDCSNGYCSQDNNKCATPTCEDSVMNGGETDIDCGGNACPGCAINKKCMSNNDCSGHLCVGNLCVASCSDNILNQDETDVDCGGSKCSKCVDDKNCANDGNCVSNFCNPDSYICKTATCQDTYMNQDESDVDCGGLCSACAVGKHCNSDTDCETNICIGNTCVVPPPTPVAAPVDVPINDQSPQTDSPVSSEPSSANSPSSSSTPSGSKTPVNKKVSSGVVVEAAVLGLGSIVVINLM